jgi:hypothetical protein
MVGQTFIIYMYVFVWGKKREYYRFGKKIVSLLTSV